MARGKKTGGRDFPPNNIANPDGRPKVPEDVKAAQKLTKNAFILVTNKYLSMTKEEIKRAATDPKTPSLELMIAGLISKAVNEGCQKRLNFLLERLIGKVPTSVDVSGEVKTTSVSDALTKVMSDPATAKAAMALAEKLSKK